MAEQPSLCAGASHVVANMFLVSPSLLLAILLLTPSPWPGKMLACCRRQSMLAQVASHGFCPCKPYWGHARRGILDRCSTPLGLQVPFGMKLGAPVSVGLYIGSSIVPDFIGNMLSATFFLSGTYAFMVSSFLRAICKPSAHVLTIVVICSTAPCPTGSTSSSPR